MMSLRSYATVIMALLLAMSASTLAFSPKNMESRRIQQRQQQTQLGARPRNPTADAVAKTMAGIMTAGLLLFSSPLPSLAEGSRVVGELKGSGLVFKVRHCDEAGLCLWPSLLDGTGPHSFHITPGHSCD